MNEFAPVLDDEAIAVARVLANDHVADVVEALNHEPRETAIELGAAGSQEAQEAQQQAYEAAGDAAERPGLSRTEVPSLTEAALEGKTVMAKRKDHEGNVVESAKPESAQITPSGRMGGEVKRAAEEGGVQAPSPQVAERQQAAARKRPTTGPTQQGVNAEKDKDGE